MRMSAYAVSNVFEQFDVPGVCVVPAASVAAVLGGTVAVLLQQKQNLHIILHDAWDAASLSCQVDASVQI
jgi:hypothetical protein